MDVFSLFLLSLVLTYVVKNRRMITKSCVTIALITTILLTLFLGTYSSKEELTITEHLTSSSVQKNGVYVYIISDFFPSTNYSLFGYLENVQEITLKVHKSEVVGSIRIPFPINANLVEVRGGSVYRTSDGYALIIPDESNEAIFRFKTICYGHTFFFKNIAYLPKDQNPLSVGVTNAIKESIQNQVGQKPHFSQLFHLHLPKDNVLLYELMEGPNVLGPIEPTYTITHRFEQIEIFYTNKYILLSPIYVLLIAMLITCLTNNISLNFSSNDLVNNLIKKRFERVLLWQFIATFLFIIGCSIIAKYAIIEETVMLYVIALTSLYQVFLAAFIASALLSIMLTKSLRINTLMSLLIYPLLFISITVCYVAASSILGMPLAAHAVPPKEFGKLVTVQSVLGCGGGNIPRLVLAFLGFCGGILYLYVSKRQELDLKVIVLAPIILVCAYYYPLIGNDLLHILFNFISGEPTVFSHPLDQAYSGLVAKASSILGGLGYRRGMVMYGIATSLLAFLRYIKSPTISSTTLLAIAPLFARGLMRVGDMKISLFLTSYLIGVCIGMVAVVCILLVDKLVKTTKVKLLRNFLNLILTRK